MAIGFAYPQLMPTMPAGPYSNLNTYIDAKIGLRASSELGGNFQLVDGAFCSSTSVFTDCMGVGGTLPPGVESSRATLAEWRAWTAATDRCWFSQAYGTVAPFSVTC